MKLTLLSEEKPDFEMIAGEAYWILNGNSGPVLNVCCPGCGECPIAGRLHTITIHHRQYHYAGTVIFYVRSADIIAYLKRSEFIVA